MWSLCYLQIALCALWDYPLNSEYIMNKMYCLLLEYIFLKWSTFAKKIIRRLATSVCFCIMTGRWIDVINK